MIAPHPEYQGLGSSEDARSRSYRNLFEQSLAEKEIDALRAHTQSGTPPGGPKFKDQIAAQLSVSTGQPNRERPRHEDSVS